MAIPALQILDSSYYDAIRSAIDPALFGDTSTLPDTLIEQATFAPAAEQELLAREAQVLPADIDPVKQANHRAAAAIYLTAARLVQHWPLLQSQKIGDSEYTRAKFDPAKRHAALRTLAERELAAYLSPTGYPVVTQSFYLGLGRRGA